MATAVGGVENPHAVAHPRRVYPVADGFDPPRTVLAWHLAVEGHVSRATQPPVGRIDSGKAQSNQDFTRTRLRGLDLSHAQNLSS
jgi:hypothetical protein